MLDEVRKVCRYGALPGIARAPGDLQVPLRNALIPTVTVAGLLVARLLGGTVVVESIFPGQGSASSSMRRFWGATIL